MSTFTKLTWPVQDVAAVGALQNAVIGVPLLLNGTLADPSIPNQVSFIKNKMIRSVSITSVNDLSGITFVITGLQNGAYVTEPITGPNNTTVYGTQYYDIVTSVVASANATGVKIGSGNAGFFPLLVINSLASFINYSASILLPVSSGINYSFFQTLDQINNNFIPFLNQTTKFFPCMGFTNETTSQIGNSNQITNFVLLKINSSATPITDTFDFIFLQE
jgi:hypothetical protein